MNSALPSGTVTLLFTDIEGSSHLWETHRSEMAIALTQHNRLLLAIVSTNDGVVVKDKGDGYIVAFSSAEDAVLCALGAQRKLRIEDWPPEIGLLNVRMALHTGSLQANDGDYHGPVINRAARIEGAASGGQVIVSDATRALTEHSLPEGVSLMDLGRYTLRGMASPEHLFQMVAPGLPSEFPRLRASAGGGVDLPQYATSFIGRSFEQNAIGDVLVHGESRLVTLLGPGGIGKTRLAIETARALEDRFAGGTFFVDLAPLENPADVGLTIAEAVGAHAEGTASMVALAAARLTRPTLVVIDNFEHLYTAATTVAELLDLAPDVRVIVTSRTPLRISSEWIFQMEPLDSHSRDGSPPAAVELFYERAMRFGVLLGTDGPDAAAVTSIVRRLDGLPLAVELVAARTRLIGIVELDALLADSFDVVGSGAADLPDRQRTIRSTIDWSLKALTDGQRSLFARLSVFPSGATLAQLDQVVGVDVDGDLLGELAVLVDNSLVNVVTDQPGGTRYRQLVLLREYGSEILRDSGATDEVMGRLVDHYVAVAPELGRRAQHSDAAGDEIAADDASLLAAMNWSIDHERVRDMVDVACHIWVYWFNGDRAMSCAQWATEADQRVDTAKLDWLKGFFALQTGDHEQALVRLTSAIERFGTARDAEWLAMSQIFAGVLHEELDVGRTMLEAAVAHFGGTEFGVNGYLARLFLSINYVARGDATTALSMREELLAWSEAEDMVGLIAWSEWNLALALIGVGRIDDADLHNRRTLAQMVADGYQEGIASAADLVAVVEFHRGHPHRALRLIGGSDSVWEAIGIARWPESAHVVAEVLGGASEHLGDAECDRILSEGRSLRLEALVDLAYQESGADPDHISSVSTPKP